MKEIYETNWPFIYRYLEDSCRILIKNGHKYKTGDGGEIDKIYKAITTINNITKIRPSDNVPMSDQFQVGKNWVDFAYNELIEFNARGYEYICSTTEALIKTNAIKRLFDGFTDPLYFRGEHNFGWELISRLGRKQKIDWNIEQPNQVTSLELDLMSDFQKKIKADEKLRTKIFGENPILNENSAGWWSIMQHYDEINGTRMIDVTSSLFTGLYFACRDWDGSVDNTKDGKLYMFPKPLGRGETVDAYRVKGQLIDHDDQLQTRLVDYYKVEEHIQIPRFRRSPVRNDRAISQDGLFVWQAKFDEAISLFQHFPFRVHRDFKESISSELKAMGFTKDKILFENRFHLSMNDLHRKWFDDSK